jgi:hypothetical protein
MDPEVAAAIIAAIVSLLGVVINYFVSQAKIKAEFGSLRLQQQHDFTEKLYEMRLEAYPEVFDITQDIGKRGERSGEDVARSIHHALESLIEWQRKRAGLILSEKSLQAYYELRTALSKQPADRDGYTDEQLKRIWFARNAFRGSLRDDVGLLHSLDDADSG